MRYSSHELKGNVYIPIISTRAERGEWGCIKLKEGSVGGIFLREVEGGWKGVRRHTERGPRKDKEIHGGAKGMRGITGQRGL